MKKLFIILLLLITTGTITPKLIEIGLLPENTIVDEESGLKAVDGKFYLDADAENYIFADAYNNFIAAQQAKGLPYILAITATKISDDKFLYYAAEAHGLNKFLFEGGDPARPYFWNRYNPQDLQQKKGGFTDFKRRPIINRINYYLINTPDDAAATLLGTDYELLQDPNKKYFMENFFKANLLNDASSLSGLAWSFEERERNLEQAKRYYKLAVNKGNFFSHIRIGQLLEKEGNIEQAKQHYQIVADSPAQSPEHIRAIAQYHLGQLLEKEGNTTDAKGYYTLAAKEDDEDAQYALGLLYEKENNLARAQYYYNLAANTGGSEKKLRNPNALYRLGIFAEKANNLNNAKYFYQKAIDIGSSINAYLGNTSDAYYGLASVAEKSFNLGTAKEYFQSAANKGNGAAPEAITRIDAKIALLQEQEVEIYGKMALLQEQEYAEPSTSSKKRQRED